MKHIFPEVPINAGTFVPLQIIDPAGTFLDARYPVAGFRLRRRGESAHRRGGISRACTRRTRSVCLRRRPAPAAISRSADAIPKTGKGYVMYLVTGGGYGGSSEIDGMSNGCSTIGISKTPPIELLEQRFPVLFEEFALAEGTGGAGRQRGGFGVRYKIALRRGEARASFVMDHGRVGPPGIFGGAPGLPNHIEIEIDGRKSVPVAFV